jgi:hypothetical protein
MFPVLMATPGRTGRLGRKTLRLVAVIDGDGVTIGVPEDL